MKTRHPDPRPVMTTREVTAALGVPQQRVTQIEQSGLRKLMRYLAARGLAFDDLG